MLIVLNIVVIIFVVGMAALWATYGFFSAFLQLIVVIASGVIALALWEPLSFWLLGRMPAYAHGVGLLAPFALSIIILRVPLDKFCKMNLHLPHLADQIGGGLCGATAGILAFGMLLNGANFLPIERGAMGWEPYSIQGTEVVRNEEGSLWTFTRVHEWSAGFYEFLSGGAMSPTGGTALAEARSDLAFRALNTRVIPDPNQSRYAHADSLKVAGVYAVPATKEGVFALVQRAAIISFLAPAYQPPAEAQYGEAGMGLVNAIKRELQGRFTDPKKNGLAMEMLNVDLINQAVEAYELDVDSPTTTMAGFEKFLNDMTTEFANKLMKNDAGQPNAFAQKLGEGKTLFIVDTHWNNTKPGAYDSDGNLRVDITQIRLQVNAGGESEMVAPIGYSVEYNQNTKGRIFTEVVTSQIYRAFAPYPDFHLGWVFVLPPNNDPIRFYARELRFDLTDLPTPDGSEEPVVQNFGAVARVFGAPLIPKPKPEGEVVIDNNQISEGAVQIGTSGSYAEITEALPASYGGATATGIEPDKTTEQWTLFEGKQPRVQKGRGGRKSTIRNIYVGQGFRLVRIQLDNRQAVSLYGKAIGLAKNLNIMRVKDEGGNAYQCIGFVLDRGNDFMDIDIRGSGVATGGVSASELPTVGDGEKLYLYFQVPVGKTIVSYALGDDDQQFEKGLLVEEKKR